MDLAYARIARSVEFGPDGEPRIDDPDCIEADRAGQMARIRAGVLVVKLAATPPECDREHQLQVRFWGEDGHTIAVWRDSIALQHPATDSPGDLSVVEGFELAGLPCDDTQNYRLEIYIDEKHRATVPVP